MHIKFWCHCEENGYSSNVISSSNCSLVIFPLIYIFETTKNIVVDGEVEERERERAKRRN